MYGHTRQYLDQSPWFDFFIACLSKAANDLLAAEINFEWGT